MLRCVSAEMLSWIYSTVLINLLNERSSGFNIDNIKKVVQEALIEHDKADLINKASDNVNSGSYAFAIKSLSSKICMSRDPI